MLEKVKPPPQMHGSIALKSQRTQPESVTSDKNIVREGTDKMDYTMYKSTKY